MNDGIGQTNTRKVKGFLPHDWTGSNASRIKRVTCSEEHKHNPNFVTRPTYEKGPQGLIKKEERYRVNTHHKITEDAAVYLPMHKKLARHFAQNACDNAMDQFLDLF